MACLHLLCLSDCNEKGANISNRTINMVGARIKIRLEGQLVDPSNELCCVLTVIQLNLSCTLLVITS